MDERSVIWVISTAEWFKTWASGQTRREGSPGFRHVGCIADADGIVIRPKDRLIFGDTERLTSYQLLAVYERLQLAKLAGDKLAQDGGL